MQKDIMGIDLIKIVENEDGSRVVSARDLHRFLVVEAKGGQKGEDFSTWIKRSIGHVKALENTDYVVLDFDYKGLPCNRESDNQAVKVHKREYALSLSLAKEISMIQNNDKGREARQYFIECEKRLKNKIVTLPSYQIEDSIERALAWIEEQKVTRQAQLKANTLEVRLDLLLDWVSIIKVAQHNKVKEKVFNWRALKKECNALGYEVKRAESPRFGYQNLYHINSFKNLYPEFNYDLKQTLE